MTTTSKYEAVECPNPECGGIRIPALHVRCACLRAQGSDWQERLRQEALQEARRWAFMRGCPAAEHHPTPSPCPICPPPFNPWPVYASPEVKLQREQGW